MTTTRRDLLTGATAPDATVELSQRRSAAEREYFAAIDARDKLWAETVRVKSAQDAAGFTEAEALVETMKRRFNEIEIEFCNATARSVAGVMAQFDLLAEYIDDRPIDDRDKALLKSVKHALASMLLPIGAMPAAAESDEPIIGLYRDWENARTAFLAALDRLAEADVARFAAEHAKLPLTRFDAAVEAAHEDEATTSDLDDGATRALLVTPSRTLHGVLLKLRRAAIDIHDDHTNGFDLVELKNASAAVITCLADLERLVAGGAA